MNIRSCTSGMRAILFLLLFLFCTASLTADGFVRARSVLAHLQAGRGDSLSAMLHPSVRAQLPVPVLSVLWTEIEGKTGKLLGQGSWRTRRTGVFRQDLCRLEFEKAALDFTLTFDDSLLSRLTESLPEEYLASERAYDALATARSLCPLPMLFLGGGHDYQVTRCDFDLWKQALSGCSAVRFVWLPACDHLMRLQSGMAVPETYTREAPLSPDALAAIEDFVNN